MACLRKGLLKNDQQEQSAGVLRVCVSLTWQLDLEPGCTVSTLKHRLKDLTRIAPKDQVLCVENAVLTDVSMLSELGGTRSPLQLQLVIDCHLSKLRDEDPVSRRRAVRSLAEHVADQWTFADEDLLLLYLDCLADPISEIRRVAAEVAMQLPHEPRIRERLRSLLRDEDEEVRAQAVVALVLAKLQECHCKANCDSVREAAHDAILNLMS